MACAEEKEEEEEGEEEEDEGEEDLSARTQTVRTGLFGMSKQSAPDCLT